MYIIKSGGPLANPLTNREQIQMYILNYFAPLMSRERKNRNYDNANNTLQCFTKTFNFSKI